MHRRQSLRQGHAGLGSFRAAVPGARKNRSVAEPGMTRPGAQKKASQLRFTTTIILYKTQKAL